jgi:hypothetical protein
VICQSNKYFQIDDSDTRKRAIALWQRVRAEASLSVLLARWANDSILLLTYWVSSRLYVGQLFANL